MYDSMCGVDLEEWESMHIVYLLVAPERAEVLEEDGSSSTSSVTLSPTLFTLCELLQRVIHVYNLELHCYELTSQKVRRPFTTTFLDSCSEVSGEFDLRAHKVKRRRGLSGVLQLEISVVP